MTGRLLHLAALGIVLAGGAISGGCQPLEPPPDPAQLRAQAVAVLAEVLERKVQPPTDSTVTDVARQQSVLAQYQLQNQALEILGEFPEIVQPAWLDAGLSSPSDGVRFSALLTVGRLAGHQAGRLSKPYLARTRQLVDSDNDFLKLAARYAVYRLTGESAVLEPLSALLARRGANPAEDRDLAALRAQTVYILSLVPALQPQELIRSLAEDPDAQVRTMVAMRLAVLGDRKARDQLLNLAKSPVADDQLDALATLGEIRLDDPEPLRVCLSTARLAEVKMAAARALGLHGDAAGLEQAIEWLEYRDSAKLAPRDAAKDPLFEQRVRVLAALALGGIGDYNRSAGPLLHAIRAGSSNRLRLAAARAALELLKRSGRWPDQAG